LKGSFYRGDAADWLFTLGGISQEAGNHMMTTELPAIHRRMEEIGQEKAGLESRRAYHREKIAKVTH